jgi:hypothetical protein
VKRNGQSKYEKEEMPLYQGIKKYCREYRNRLMVSEIRDEPPPSKSNKFYSRSPLRSEAGSQLDEKFVEYKQK